MSEINLNGMSCCGLQEIGGLSSYRNSQDAFMGLCNNYDDPINTESGSAFGCGAIIFTQAGKGATYGTRFAKYIAKHKLGEVTALPSFRNPNSGSHIVTFFWKFDSKAVRTLYKELKKLPKYDEDGDNYDPYY